MTLPRRLELNRIFSGSLILVGSFLEIYFYFYRFTQDGLAPWICGVIASALSLLLCMATYNLRSSKKWLVLFIPLLCYSVFSTSAGQTFVLINKESVPVATTIISTNENKSKQTQKEINRLNAEADSLTATNAAYDTPELQAKYRTTIQKNRDRLDAIDKTLKEKSASIESSGDNIANTQKSTIKATSVYEFYGSITTWTATEWIKFIFHSILSIFIAIMAPVGIATWGRVRMPVVETPAMPHIKILPEYIDLFVEKSWWRLEYNTGDIVLPKSIVMEQMAKSGVTITDETYDALYNIAVRACVISEDGTIITKDKAEAIGKIKELI